MSRCLIHIKFNLIYLQWVMQQLRIELVINRFKYFLGQKQHNNLVHIYVSLSPSSITWYWLRSSDALQLGR